MLKEAQNKNQSKGRVLIIILAFGQRPMCFLIKWVRSFLKLNNFLNRQSIIYNEDRHRIIRNHIQFTIDQGD